MPIFLFLVPMQRSVDQTCQWSKNDFDMPYLSTIIENMDYIKELTGGLFCEVFIAVYFCPNVLKWPELCEHRIFTDPVRKQF